MAGREWDPDGEGGRTESSEESDGLAGAHALVETVLMRGLGRRAVIQLVLVRNGVVVTRATHRLARKVRRRGRADRRGVVVGKD